MRPNATFPSTHPLAAGASALAILAAAVVASVAGPPAPAAAAPDPTPVSQCDAIAAGGSCTLGPSADHTPYTWTVPAGLTRVLAVVRGASGAVGSHTGTPGAGGIVIAEIPVTPGQDLTLWVATQGDSHIGGRGWGTGGYGGTNSIPGLHDGAGGGGASAIVDSHGKQDPLVVAGGGGGAGSTFDEYNLVGGEGGAGSPDGEDGEDGDEYSDGAPDNGGRGGYTSGHDGESSGSDQINPPGGGGGGGYRAGESGGIGVFVGFNDGPEDADQYHQAGGGGGGGSNHVRSDATEVFNGTGAIATGQIQLLPTGKQVSFSCQPGSHTHDVPWQHYSPPEGTEMIAIAIGGNGGRGSNANSPARAALAMGTFDTLPGEDLSIAVGCAGDNSRNGYGYGADGGNASGAPHDGGGGGGGTAIMGGGKLLLVAGGGGGAGGHADDIDQGGDGGEAGLGWGRAGAGSGKDTGSSGGCGGCERNDDGSAKNSGSLGHSGDPGGGGGGGGGGYQGGAGGNGGGLGLGGGGGGAGSSYYDATRVRDPQVAPSSALHFAGKKHNDGLVILILVRQTAQLSVFVPVDKPADYLYPVGPFQIDSNCTYGGQTVLDTSEQVQADGQLHYPGLPIGASCTVSEPASGDGDAAVRPDAQTIEIVAGDNAVAMRNSYALTSAEITVQVAGASQFSRGNIVEQFSCTMGGKPFLLPLPPPYNHGMLEFSEIGGALIISDLPLGAVCSLAQSGGSATKVEYSVSDPDVAVSTDPLTGIVLGTLTKFVVTDTWQTSTLTVAKQVIAEGPNFPFDTDYQMQVDCRFGSRAISSDTITVRAGNQVVQDEIPVGASCEVTENDTKQATSTTFSPARTVTIAADGSSKVTVTNLFADGSLALTKVVTGTGTQFATAPSTAELSCVLGDDPAVVEEVQLPAGGGYVMADDDIPTGSVCTVRETDTGGATSTSFTTSNDPTGTTDDDSATVTIGEQTTVGVTIENTFDAAPLQVETLADGDGLVFAGTTDIEVTCRFNGDEVDSTTFTFGHAAGAAQVPLLPVGARCDVVQADNGGASVVTPSATNAGNPTEIDGGLRVTVQAPDADGTPTTVHFDNDFVTSQLTVTTTVDGSAAYAANTDFRIQLECTLDGRPLFTLGTLGGPVFTVPATGGSFAVTVPGRAHCTVTEPGDGGASTVTLDPADAAVVVPADGSDLAVTVANTFDGADLHIANVLAGNGADLHADLEFPIQTECRFNGRHLVPAGNPPTSFALAGGQDATIVNLPVGASCTVAETSDDNASKVSYRATDPNATITDSSAQITVLAAGTPVNRRVGVLAVPAGAANVVTITNTFEVGNLTVTAQLTGPGASVYGAGRSFRVQVACRQQLDNGWVTMHLPDGGRLTLDPAGNLAAGIDDLPAGWTCALVDADTGLATGMVLGDPAVIPVDGTDAFEITYDWELGSVAVTKQVKGESAVPEFGFTVGCTALDRDQSPAATVVIAPVGAPDFSLAEGEHQSVTALAGAECTIAETDSGGARTITYRLGTADPAPLGDGVVLRLSQTSTPTLTVINSFAAVAPTPTPSPSPTPTPTPDPDPNVLPITGATIGGLVLLAVALLGLGLALRRTGRHQ